MLSTPDTWGLLSSLAWVLKYYTKIYCNDQCPVQLLPPRQGPIWPYDRLSWLCVHPQTMRPQKKASHKTSCFLCIWLSPIQTKIASWGLLQRPKIATSESPRASNQVHLITLVFFHQPHNEQGSNGPKSDVFWGWGETQDLLSWDHPSGMSTCLSPLAGMSAAEN